LDQLLAPIALYPDSLLSQMFMASTYPLEIVQADRWVKAKKDLKGDALAAELERQTWDPSVKSMVNFPSVLSTMSESLDVTVKLGDAFIGQQEDVLRTVQTLRAKAKAQGNLKSTDEQKVSVEPAPTGASPAEVITIEPVKMEVIYVPVYSPTVVYGVWPYPTYPPYPYYPPYPPGYVASPVIGFGVGLVCGVAWGYAWGNCNWGHGHIDIDINRNVNFNGTINRNNYQNNFNRGGTGGGAWQHNPSHRQGVPYRNQATSQKFGAGNQSAQATKARDDFRGRSEAGKPDNVREGANQRTPDGRDSRSGAGGAQRPDSSESSRPASPAPSRGGAFDGAGGGADRTRAASQRGQSSRGGARPSAPSRGGRR
jgi:hypothetical protein